MKCKKAKELLLDCAELSEMQKKSLEEHFENCPECLNEYEGYKASLGLLKKTLAFKPPQNYWEKFSLELKSYPPLLNFKSYFQDKVDFLFSLLRTPLLGPIPAYVFSLLLLIFATFSFSSLFRSGEYYPSNLVNNLIINEAQFLSASDDGFITIYTVSQK